MLTFKDYTMDQLQLPLSFEDFIPENHLVRVVNTIVDSLDLSPLYDRYKQGGCPAYHPRMMLKVMIYSYSQKTYSSRMIAKALRENINFMWIAGGNKTGFPYDQPFPPANERHHRRYFLRSCQTPDR